MHVHCTICTYSPGLWICIQFLWIRIQPFSQCRSGSGFSITNFVKKLLYLEFFVVDKKDCTKVIYNYYPKKFLKISPAGTGAILETPPLPPWRGGGVEKSCVTYEFPGWFCRLFIFLGVRGASSKTIKACLNCWHVFWNYATS